MSLPDIQKEEIDDIELDEVGVGGVQLPFKIRRKNGGYSSVKAEMKMGTSLSGKSRGAHMSRFLTFIEEQSGSNVTMEQIAQWLDVLMKQQESDSATISMEFEYPVRKFAPVTETPGTIYYDVEFKVKPDRKVMVVNVPATTLCPCSREISEYGAHNQNATITIAIRLNEDFVWIEDIIEIAERNASAPIYAALKREDEKAVTEEAYENPKFVEDVCRDVAKDIKENLEFVDAIVKVSSHESIHQHDAYAKVLIGCELDWDF